MRAPARLPSVMSLSADYQRDWPAYFDEAARRPARDTLVRALDAFEREHGAQATPPGVLLAIDLACGEGRDTREILRRAIPRWTVIALDNHPDGVRRTLAGIAPHDLARVSVSQLALEDVAQQLSALHGRARLINASFALPFCAPGAFGALWAWLVGALAPGGRFAGQLFGDRDEWAPIDPARHYSRAHVERLLAPFDVEHFQEVDQRGTDGCGAGATKHHHLFHIVARKR